MLTLKDNGCTLPKFKSLMRFDDTIYLNLYESHLSYITDIELYCQKFECPNCNKHFKYRSRCFKHMQTCNLGTTYHFPGGYYNAQKSVFDKLELHGISVPEEDRYFNYFIVYDLEACLKPLTTEGEKNTIMTEEHIPISVSICSNVDGYTEPHCIVNPDPEQLVREMIVYMTSIQSSAQSLIHEKLSYVTKQSQRLLH